MEIVMAKIIDKVNLPEVAEFVEKQLAPFDVSKLDWFKLLPLRRDRWRGWHKEPKRVAPGSRKFVHQYRLNAYVNPGDLFSWHERFNVPRKRRGSGRESVNFADARELLVFAAGFCAYGFLRHSKQVQGRNSNTADANCLGLKWLDSWRYQHTPRRREAVLATRRKFEQEGD